jgi:hypothetical protein
VTALAIAQREETIAEAHRLGCRPRNPSAPPILTGPGRPVEWAFWT